ncbi:methionine biosynthesis protein MetW [Propionibacteriaceae bacterium Y1923]|uniref:methionine biosynthesis protein MetW n=1 Tax=Aestuariimicrobium sp. Y1814 TaxID=3418742 RepID=UPI003C19B7E0
MIRPDLDLLAHVVPEGSRVLDLGCGNGQLLRHLIVHHGCRGTGVDIDNDAVLEAISAGVEVIELDLDTQLGQFADDSYDVVVLSRTLQVVLDPEAVLGHMARIGKHLVVSMPNFGLWKHRLRLLSGHMPRGRDLPYDWYNSPNLHHATVVDLEDFLTSQGLVIEERVALSEGGAAGRLPKAWPNLLAGAMIYRLSSKARG